MNVTNLTFDGSSSTTIRLLRACRTPKNCVAHENTIYYYHLFFSSKKREVQSSILQGQVAIKFQIMKSCFRHRIQDLASEYKPLCSSLAFFPAKSGGFCQHCKTVGSIIFTYSCFLLIKISLYRLFLSCVSTCLFLWKSKKTACGSFHGCRKKSKTAFVKCARKKTYKKAEH